MNVDGDGGDDDDDGELTGICIRDMPSSVNRPVSYKFWYIFNSSYAAALGRCNSTPGLVESKGKVPLEDMWVSPVEPEKPIVPLQQQHHPPHPTVNPTTSNSSLHSSEEDKSKANASKTAGPFYASGNVITLALHPALPSIYILHFE